MNKIAAAALALCLGQPALAASLSTKDTNLGRINAIKVKDGLSVSADIGEDIPVATHVVARFQNNQPLMLGRDGLWAPWNGDIKNLDEASALIADRRITFPIFTALPDGLFYPVSFTVMYRTEAGLKSGTITVDAP